VEIDKPWDNVAAECVKHGEMVGRCRFVRSPQMRDLSLLDPDIHLSALRFQDGSFPYDAQTRRVAISMLPLLGCDQ